MEQIITLKVDLEYPEEAHHAIDEATRAYEEDKLKWTEAGNGCWRVPKRCQQGDLDGEVHQPML